MYSDQRIRYWLIRKARYAQVPGWRARAGTGPRRGHAFVLPSKGNGNRARRTVGAPGRPCRQTESGVMRSGSKSSRVIPLLPWRWRNCAMMTALYRIVLDPRP